MARVTVEDCLEVEPNRFSLVVLAATRAKQLLMGAPPLVTGRDNKEVVTALREIAAGKVRWMTEEEIEEEKRRREQERQARAVDDTDDGSTNNPDNTENGSDKKNAEDSTVG